MVSVVCAALVVVVLLMEECYWWCLQYLKVISFNVLCTVGANYNPFTRELSEDLLSCISYVHTNIMVNAEVRNEVVFTMISMSNI